ncbi:MAG: hypothetical protein RMK94_15745 [Armatimonadota bacterium]|nr:hypothetical protein [Armatimonadota bacterium]
MREKGTALQLQDAYGREFPKDLWEHLCSSFGDDKAKQAVEERTLESLGQLCERKDLSNGPRTVINAFKRIAQHYQQTRRAYTPIDLIDDYLQGHIVFEGAEMKLTRTVRSLLEMPTVQGDVQRQEAVKLLAAFPRGVDEIKAGKLYSVIEDLADKERWLGEHITQLSEGYALVGLQERAEARPLIDEIVRDFRRKWHQTYSEYQKKNLAIICFLQEILPLLFPQRTQGQYANFGGHRRRAQDFERDERGVFYEVLEGCFERLFSRFPDRKVCVSVSADENSLNRFKPPDEDIDLDFRFFLDFPENEGEPNRIFSANGDRRVDFHLNMKRTFERQFPPDLAFLHDIMAPERTSAQVLLALSMRMWGWLEEHPETSEADRQMIEANRRALHRYALQLLLPDASETAKVELKGIKVSGAEQRLIESAFEAKCAELYPDYKPLMITKEWKNHLRRYRDALGKRPLAERRGRQPFVGSKDEIAKAFGWSHTVFEANARILQNMGLLTFRWGSGRGAESEARVLFQEHPLETFLLKILRNEGQVKIVSIGRHNKKVKSIEVIQLLKSARQQGYLAEEVDEALELLNFRQYIQREPDGTVHEFAGAIDAEELVHQAEDLKGRLELLTDYFRNELNYHGRLLHEAQEYLKTPEDEIALDAAQRKLDELRARLDEFIKVKGKEFANRLASTAEEMERRISELTPHELEQQVTGVVEFVRHVDDQRKVLQKKFRQLKQRWEQLCGKVKQAQQKAQATADEKSIHQIASEHEEIHESKKELESELNNLRTYLTGLLRWREVVTKATSLRERLEPESELRRELDEDVTTAIMENFATRQLEALLDWERFEADIDRIDAELEAEENRKRNEFYQAKEEYEEALGRLIPQRTMQATFDPKDIEQSYQVLHQGVMRKLQDWLNEQQEFARQILSEFDFLMYDRGVKADDERKFAQEVLGDLIEANEALNHELVSNFEEFQRYCSKLEEISRQIRDLKGRLERKRAEKEPPSDEELELLELLTTHQRLSLDNLRRQLPYERLNLDDLFNRLKGLYRKGHIQIEVRKRE